MNYYELKIVLSPNTETNRDILAALLAEIGFESFTESENGLDAYISEKNYSEDAISGLLSDIPLIDTELTYSINYVKAQDWNEEWEKNFFQPIIIDDKCVIHSSFHKDIPSLPYDIVIDPKMAFGTGNHATTWLMISEMLKLDLTGKELLDMGCGTAVLAILAAKKGAGRVDAIDIDEWAYDNALENIRLNHTEDVRVVLGGAEKIDAGCAYDFIFANINRNILLQDMGVYAGVLKKDATLFMSGFYTEDIPVIEAECGKHGLVLQSVAEKDNWAAVRVSY